MAVRAPHCYLALSNADASSFTLLLEDLAPAAQGDQVAGAPLEEVLVAVRNLAGLHGPRWCDAGLRDAGWPQPGGPGAHRFTADLVSGALPQLSERLGAALSAPDRSTLEQAASVMADFLGARPERFAPIHGDYRLDNLLFAPEGTVWAVDWQTLDLGLPPTVTWPTFWGPACRCPTGAPARLLRSVPIGRNWCATASRDTPARSASTLPAGAAPVSAHHRPRRGLRHPDRAG